MIILKDNYDDIYPDFNTVKHMLYLMASTQLF